jgi:hypothetical protein
MHFRQDLQRVAQRRDLPKNKEEILQRKRRDLQRRKFAERPAAPTLKCPAFKHDPLLGRADGYCRERYGLDGTKCRWLTAPRCTPLFMPAVCREATGVHELPLVAPAAKNVFVPIVFVVPASSRMPTHASIMIFELTLLLLPVEPQLASR